MIAEKKIIVDKLQNKENQNSLFQEAEAIKKQYCGTRVHLRGVIEFSSYCTCKCLYCGMRSENHNSNRYRISREEVLETAKKGASYGIESVFLQSGRDPKYDDILIKAIRSIKEETNLDIILCVGERSFERYKEFKEAGADGYVLKFESSDRKLFKYLKSFEFERRLKCVKDLQKANFKVGTGCIVGLPYQSLDSLADDILLIKKLGTDMASASIFVPHQATAFKNYSPGDFWLTLRVMAIMRILTKNTLIPATSTLQRYNKKGQLLGLKAGANVITINLTPTKYRAKYGIYDDNRTIIDLDHARSVIRKYSDAA